MCRRSRSAMVSSLIFLLSIGSIFCRASKTRAIIHSGFFLKKLSLYANVHPALSNSRASLVFILNVRTCSTKSFISDPNAPALPLTAPPIVPGMPENISIKYVVISRDAYDKRVQAFIRHKDIATPRKNDKRHSTIARPLGRFVYVFFGRHVCKIPCRPSYLEGCKRRKRNILLYIQGHVFVGWRFPFFSSSSVRISSRMSVAVSKSSLSAAF